MVKVLRLSALAALGIALISVAAAFSVAPGLAPGVQAAGEWTQIGPFGGDVRSLAARPGDFSRLFLGTSNSQIYASLDGGRSWRWLSQVIDRPDFVVDHVLIDPVDRNTLYAGAWSTEPDGGGGVFKSTDGGLTWRPLPGMTAQSVRALVQAQNDPRLLVAGSLEGVFRTRNAGVTWERISPAHHEEIRNIASLALDPKDPDIIYAGTWHLPWKTNDGGRTWSLIKTGIIDDSDIFSIVVDWSDDRKMYASACSGIYGTSSAGEVWQKIQGIPHSARRTRVIRQDPKNAAVVYAGTTEGLWKTETGGESWRRLTSAKLIVNDIAIDAGNTAHLVLGTDRAGVLTSRDAGETFTPTNQGFAHRQVSSTAFDPSAGRIYAAVLNDKEYGGVFHSKDGREWDQLNAGLDDRDIFALIYARTGRQGRLLAGTREGIVALDPEKNTWSATGRIVGRVSQPVPPRSTSGKKAQHSTTRRNTRSTEHRAAGAAEREKTDGYLKASVSDFFQAAPDQPLYAATATGVLKSTDAGSTWIAVSPRFPTSTIAAEGNFLVAGYNNGLELSFNGGVYWFHIYLPAGSDPTHVNAVALSGKLILAATEAGLFRSADRGATWERKGRGMPISPVSGVRIRPGNASEVYATARNTGNVYVSEDGGQTFRALARHGLVGWRLGSLHILPRRGPAQLDLVVASAFDGLFVRPLATLSAASSGSSTSVNRQ